MPLSLPVYVLLLKSNRFEFRLVDFLFSFNSRLVTSLFLLYYFLLYSFYFVVFHLISARAAPFVQILV
jgi:hypothetical protein